MSAAVHQLGVVRVSSYCVPGEVPRSIVHLSQAVEAKAARDMASAIEVPCNLRSSSKRFPVRLLQHWSDFPMTQS